CCQARFFSLSRMHARSKPGSPKTEELLIRASRRLIHRLRCLKLDRMPSGFVAKCTIGFLSLFVVGTAQGHAPQSAKPATNPDRVGAAAPAALFAQGQAALNSGALDAAEAAFRKVLSADPRSGAAYANLGVIAMRRRQWDHALVLLQKAEKLDPKMAGVRLNIGLVKYRQGDYPGSIE